MTHSITQCNILHLSLNAVLHLNFLLLPLSPSSFSSLFSLLSFPLFSNFKLSLKLLNVSITRSGRLPVLVALLALTHSYMHSPKEARRELHTLPQTNQLDQITLNTLALVYRSLEDGKKKTDTETKGWQRACRENDTVRQLIPHSADSEIMFSLFFSFLTAPSSLPFSSQSDSSVRG